MSNPLKLNLLSHFTSMWALSLDPCYLQWRSCHQSPTSYLHLFTSFNGRLDLSDKVILASINFNKKWNSDLLITRFFPPLVWLLLISRKSNSLCLFGLIFHWNEVEWFTLNQMLAQVGSLMLANFSCQNLLDIYKFTTPPLI